jgi:hypothetical protein
MSQPTIAAAIENIYASLKADNADLDQHIADLRQAMAAEGQSVATFDPARLAQNNRQGRKLMQSYFRKRGVEVVFEGGAA